MFSLTVVCQNVPAAVQYSRNEPVYKATTCPKMVSANNSFMGRLLCLFVFYSLNHLLILKPVDDGILKTVCLTTCLL